MTAKDLIAQQVDEYLTRRFGGVLRIDDTVRMSDFKTIRNKSTVRQCLLDIGFTQSPSNVAMYIYTDYKPHQCKSAPVQPLSVYKARRRNLRDSERELLDQLIKAPLSVDPADRKQRSLIATKVCEIRKHGFDIECVSKKNKKNESIKITYTLKNPKQMRIA